MNVTDLLELARFATGMTKEQWDGLSRAMKSDAEMNRIMKEDWNRKPRDSEEAIRDYYRNSNAWFVNTFNHGYMALLSMASGATAALSPWQAKFVEMMEYRGGAVLDYGGGFFKDIWPLSDRGYRVDVAEISGPVTRFLKAFLSAADLTEKFGVIEVDSFAPITKAYQGIACFETLEHVLHPKTLAAHLYQHLLPGGPFAFSVTFGAPEHAPYHVASNAYLAEWPVWAEALRKIGFSPCWDDPDGSSTRIWRRGS